MESTSAESERYMDVGISLEIILDCGSPSETVLEGSAGRELLPV